MEQSRKRVKKLLGPDDFKYAARQYKDYAIAKEMQDDLKVMATVALGNLDYEITSSKEPSNFGVANLDPKWHWFCYVKGRGYMFWAESEIGLYCKIIERIVGDRLYIPFSN